jgi:hypothetical protein
LAAKSLFDVLPAEKISRQGRQGRQENKKEEFFF